ncbi:hypothetical protein RPC_2901 [Rhodopseudomonas palustris BisB18]|uniref:Uncharacterized protein n=1 Tax=Rhodopseudomonas palustris (strain BisB18) TaxID=316056 RepID=Q213I7_RHOPB
MQPDFPAVSCCGEADAYWADSHEIADGQYVAIITNPRPDAPLRRPHLEIGTKIVVPNHKLKSDSGNPTGHGIIFLGGPGHVFCHLPPTGCRRGRRAAGRFCVVTADDLGYNGQVARRWR